MMSNATPVGNNIILKALKKVYLDKGQTKTITLELDEKCFGLYDDEGRLMLYKGDYEIYVGSSQPDARSIALTGKKPACIPIRNNDEDRVLEYE